MRRPQRIAPQRVQGSLLRNSAHDNLLFSPACLTSGDPCAAVGTDAAASARYGLYALLRWYGRSALALALLPPAQLASAGTASPELAYIWAVGQRDVAAGGAQLVSQYQSDVGQAPLFIEKLLVSLLVIVFCGSMAFQVYVFRPWMSTTLRESRVVAELLAQLPADVNVEGMLEDALGVAERQASLMSRTASMVSVGASSLGRADSDYMDALRGDSA